MQEIQGGDAARDTIYKAFSDALEGPEIKYIGPKNVYNRSPLSVFKK